MSKPPIELLHKDFKSIITNNINWVNKKIIKVHNDVYHTQGMFLIDEYYFISTVKIIKEIDRKKLKENGIGIGYILRISKQGEILDKIKLNDINDKCYHPGGIEYDGKYLWIPNAEYRPNSSTNILRINIKTFKIELMFKVKDHIGALVYDRKHNILYGMNWGSQFIYSWKLDGTLIKKYPNLSNIAFQDCQYAGMDTAFCSGIVKNTENNKEIGGLELLNLKTGELLLSLPSYLFEMDKYLNEITLTRNPMFIEKISNGMRFHFMPEEGLNSNIHIMELNFYLIHKYL